MIGQYLLNNNETVTIAFRQNFYQLNSPLETQTQTAETLSPLASGGGGGHRAGYRANRSFFWAFLEIDIILFIIISYIV
jgi:hypothetical protein